MSISIVQLIKEVLVEAKGQTYNYGCVMLYFKFPEQKKLHKLIQEEDIYTEEGDRSYGLEEEPHTTLLYGLHDVVTLADVKGVLDKFQYSACEIYNPSLFENDKYDVLKFDVKGPELKATNKALSKFPFTTDYPDYHPHLTIAYIKKGLGKKYTHLFKGSKYNLTPWKAVYSMPDGTKHNIKIKAD
jgi:hypothetical protein